jgi:hypothetical protein
LAARSSDLDRPHLLDWLAPPPETPVDRAIREPGERMSRAFSWLDARRQLIAARPMADLTDKAREIRVRQALARQGYHLVKGRAGGFQIVDALIPRVVAGNAFAMCLAAVEEWAKGNIDAEPPSD